MTKGKSRKLSAHHTRKWQRNHVLIRKELVKFLRKEKRPPTDLELAKVTGITEQTIRNHRHELDILEYFEDEKKKAATLLPEVIMSIYASAKGGSAKSQELFLQAVVNWEKQSGVKLKDADGGSLTEGLANVLESRRRADANARGAGGKGTKRSK